MNKDEYFNTIHKRISQELGVSVGAVETIRSFALGPKKYSRGQILLWLREKIAKSSKQTIIKNEPVHSECSDCKHMEKHQHIIATGTPSPKYVEIENFIKRADESAWKDMIYPYSFNGQG